MPYLAGGKAYKKAVGSRAEVMHGNAHHTSGGLRKSGLKYVGSKSAGTRRIVAVKASDVAAKRYRKQLRDPDFRRKWAENKIDKKARRRSSGKGKKSDKKKKKKHHSAKKPHHHSAKKHHHSAKKHRH